MGVTGVYKYLKKSTWKPSPGQFIFMDTSIIVYQLCAIGEKHKIKNHHLRGILYKLLAYLYQNIYPVFIFDGPPPAIKLLRENTLSIRSALGDVRKMLNEIGAPILQAHGEADVLAAQLAKLYNSAVVTTDSDVLLYGAPRMINGDTVYEAPDMPYERFLDLCILLGTDYNPRVCSYNIATKILDKHGSLKNYINIAPATYQNKLKNYEQIVNIYNSVDPTPFRARKYSLNKPAIDKIFKNILTETQLKNIHTRLPNT